MKRKDQTDLKNFYPAPEVARILNLKSHILKYWETKIPEIKPIKIANRKYYTQGQIETLKKIKTLVEEGYTLSAVKREIKKQKKEEIIAFQVLSPDLANSYSSKKEKIREQNNRDLRSLLKDVLEELIDIYKHL